MKSLQLDIAEKSYANGVCTLRDVQLTVQYGEFVAIIGPSGTGKTTLLNVVAGLETITRGQLTADGVPFQADQHPLGFMFQEPRLLPWLTALENILLVRPEVPCRQAGDDRCRDFMLRLERLLEQVDLTEFRDAYPRQLSGGMQRRIALVRAFVNHPEVLLMDEPFQSLDAPTARQLRRLLLDLWEATKPLVLFVTHDLLEALELADRVIFLSARPGTVILDYSIIQQRPRSPAFVSALSQQLLNAHPDLLSGRAGALDAAGSGFGEQTAAQQE